jgi:hypothetical protein
VSLSKKISNIFTLTADSKTGKDENVPINTKENDQGKTPRNPVIQKKEPIQTKVTKDEYEPFSAPTVPQRIPVFISASSKKSTQRENQSGNLKVHEGDSHSRKDQDTNRSSDVNFF